MRPPWMDPDVEGPTALCVTDPAARDALRWASDVPGRANAPQVQSAYDEAKRWCNRCPVAEQCLTWALAWERGDGHNRDGIYGARTPTERASLAGHVTKQKAGPTLAWRMTRQARRTLVALSLTVTCPKCNWEPGMQCHSDAGHRTEPHKARIELAEQVQAHEKSGAV